jgi:hypothetical protein
MNAPSRKMPAAQAPGKAPIWAWLLFGAWCSTLVYGLYAGGVARYLVVGFGLIGLVSWLTAERHFTRLRKQRSEDSICTFAKLLPAREHDTWIVRAVYEEVTRWTKLPIRPSDHFSDDLRLDVEDLQCIAEEVGRRSGRVIGDTLSNPMFDRVVTVADMIIFFEHQPKIEAKPS